MKRNIQLITETRGRVILRAPGQHLGREIPGSNLSLAELQKQLQNAPDSLEELIPKETDYVSAKFRAISAAYLGPGGYYLDFSRPGVLQQALPMFLDQERGGTRSTVLKVHRNHSDRVEDIVGFVEAAWWDESGQFPAPGINVDNRIDWKIAPNEVRALLSTPPLIDSVSLDVAFSFEQSHPDMDFWTFWELLGREVDGEVVRLIVTEIHDIAHIALVWSGGDPNAKQIKEELNATLQEDFWGVDRQAYARKLGIDTGNGTFGKHSYHKPKNMEGDNMGLQIQNVQAFQETLNLETISSESDLLDAVRALVEANHALQEKIREQEALVEAGKIFLEDMRQETLRMARILQDGELEPERETLIMQAELSTLKLLHRDYQKQLEKMFPEKCADCGSTNIARRSSLEEPPDDPGKNNMVDERHFKVG